MDYLAVLDYEHLDNGVFLASFARSLSKKNERGIIIHGDSEYTDRIVQTGVMRKDARIRAIKELNHRLVALFADEGISTIALNGFQKSLITTDGVELHLDREQLLRMPPQPTFLISNLVLNRKTGSVEPVALAALTQAISDAYEIEDVILFSIDDSAEVIKQSLPEKMRPDSAGKEFSEKHIPVNFRSYSGSIRLLTASNF